MEGDTALGDGATNYRRKQTNPSTQKKAWCPARLLLGMSIFFFLSIIGIVVVFLWRELVFHRPTEQRHENVLMEQNLTENVLKKFQGYFRTPEEQESFVNNLNRLNTGQPIVVNQTVYDFRYNNCSIDCNGSNPKFRRKRQTYASGSIFHGCCVSNTYFSSPNAKMNVFGVNRTLVQYQGWKQYFQATNCSSVLGCTGCICIQDRSIQTAVVVKAGVTSPDDVDDFEISFFYFDGCCTCRNT
ncbi:hypothetical protein CHS0354_008853 [Potamilus streckersoni]|uniref:Uncharacterized protein n=1 Tax=Potamilus streckersoni TaxID=2493646 RepID=A0AAE0VXZ6_9BIVA|nr:hypothetical protein CHS0354_008853 [Potamilus streckersoni]